MVERGGQLPDKRIEQFSSTSANELLLLLSAQKKSQKRYFLNLKSLNSRCELKSPTLHCEDVYRACGISLDFPTHAEEKLVQSLVCHANS